MKLEEYFHEYKSITLAAINAVQEEDYEKLNVSMEQREEIINALKSSDFLKSEIGIIYKNIGIEVLDKKLAEDIELKKDMVKQKLQQIADRKKGMSGYNNLSSKAVFLSKKI